jgi:hypothetical protein
MPQKQGSVCLRRGAKIGYALSTCVPPFYGVSAATGTVRLLSQETSTGGVLLL